MNTALRQNRVFFAGWLLFVCVAALALAFHSKMEIQAWINTKHAPFFDFFFFYATKAAEGIGLALLVLYTLLHTRAHLFSLLTGWTSAALSTQLLKHTLFEGVKRPRTVFKDTPGWHWVEGVRLYESASFPSGHTTDIFALMCLFALWSGKQLTGACTLAVALLVGFSRIYLSQHFLPDVLAGSVVGVSWALIWYHVFFHSQWAQQRPALRKAILPFLHRKKDQLPL